jgi:hypothetical protein
VAVLVKYPEQYDRDRSYNSGDTHFRGWGYVHGVRLLFNLACRSVKIGAVPGAVQSGV